MTARTWWLVIAICAVGLASGFATPEPWRRVIPALALCAALGVEIAARLSRKT